MKWGFERLWEALVVNPCLEHGRVPNVMPMMAMAIISSRVIS